MPLAGAQNAQNYKSGHLDKILTGHQRVLAQMEAWEETLHFLEQPKER